MRLADLHPSFIDALGRRGIGVAFDCPAWLACRACGTAGRHALLFLDPLDGGPRLSDAELAALPAWVWEGHPGSPVRRWHRVGDTLDELSLSPRVDAAGGWFAWISGGKVLLGGPRPLLPLSAAQAAPSGPGGSGARCAAPEAPAGHSHLRVVPAPEAR
jgi:hypothetical protein